VSTRDGLTISDLPFLANRSLALDLRILRLSGWSRRRRAAFLAGKPRAVANLVRGAPTRMHVGGVPFVLGELSDVGTLQSAIADVHELLGPLRQTLRRTPVVIDVGAHRGEFLVATKQVFPWATVRSFEPDPSVHADLVRNAAHWPEVTTRCMAIGDRTTTMPLHRAPLSAMSSLVPPSERRGDTDHTVDVPVVTLDDACADLSHVDILKVDVEGFEDAVVRGAAEVLRRTRFLLIELGMARSGASNLEVLGTIHHLCPTARITAIGRPLGSAASTLCQDVLIDLNPRGSEHEEMT
jgi:FkbM family methyltransferase